MLAKNRIKELVGLLGRLFEQQSLYVSLRRFSKVSAEFSESIVKGEALFNEQSLFDMALNKQAVVGIAGYLETLLTETKHKSNDHKTILEMCTGGTYALSPLELELTVFLVEAERMLKKACQTPRSQEEVTDCIKDFFSNMKKVEFYYNGTLNIAEAATFLGLIENVLSHRALKLEHNNRDNNIKLNLNALSQGVIKHTIDSFMPDTTLELRDANADLENFVAFLPQTHIDSCAYFMWHLKKLYNESASRCVVTLSQARSHQFLIGNMQAASKSMKNYLSYKDVSWMLDIKAYDVDKFTNFSWHSIDTVIRSILSISCAAVALLACVAHYEKQSRANMTKEDAENLSDTIALCKISSHVLVLGAILYTLGKADGSIPPRIFLFPTVKMNFGTMYHEPHQWGQDRLSPPRTFVLEVPSAPPENIQSVDVEDDLFFDAQEEHFYDAISDLSNSIAQPAFLADKLKSKKLRSAYANLMRHIKRLNPHAVTFFEKLHVKFIRKDFMDISRQANFFVKGEFNEKDYCKALLNVWAEVLRDNEMEPFIVEAPKRVEPVSPIVMFTSTADKWRHEVSSVLHRCLRVKQFSEKSDVRFMQILYMRYDLLLVCKALREVETQDSVLYRTMISADSPVTLSAFIKALKKDQIEHTCLFGLYDILKDVVNSPVKLTYVAKETESEDELRQKYDALKALMNRATLNVPAHEKRAFMMAMVEIVRLSERLGEAVDERFVPIVRAFDNYQAHKTIFDMYKSELETILRDRSQKVSTLKV